MDLNNHLGHLALKGAGVALHSPRSSVSGRLGQVNTGVTSRAP
jgi:hypothetical protein